MEKVLRSFIHERFDLDTRVQIELIGRRRDLKGPEKKAEVIKLLQERDIGNFVNLGPGTNRYAFKLDGFVVKVATDSDGKIDNLKEFMITKILFPYVTKSYEVATNGNLLVAEYIQPFSSPSEMLRYAPRIREILTELSSVYLIGDVGISSINYGNWGLRVGSNEPVCLDYAYVYAVSSNLFVCRECRTGMLVPDKDFNILCCNRCNRTKTFSDIRGLIGDDVHRHEIGDLTQIGYEMRSSFVNTVLTESRSNYLQSLKKKEVVNEEIDNQDFDSDDQDILKEDNDMSDMSKLSGQLLEQNSEAFKNGITLTPVSVISMDEAPEGIEIVGVQKEEKKPEEPLLVVGDPVRADDLNNDDESDVAFSGKIVEVPEEKEENEDPHDILLNPSFYKNFNSALSRLSNRIAWGLKASQLYEEVKPYLKDKMMLPKAFYENLQNSIYHSLAAFCNCSSQHDAPNKNSEGTHKEYDAPNVITGTTYEPTLIYMARMWMDPDIIHIKDDAATGDSYNAAIMTYFNKYDDNMGIQNEWLAVFKERLSKKIYIDNVGLGLIVQRLIADHWCLPYPKEEEEVEEPENAIEPDTEEDSLEAIEKEIEDEIFGDEDDGEATNNEEAQYMSIEIYRHGALDGKTDIIKVFTSDNMGPVIIPIYVDLDKVDISTPLAPSLVDDRNGEWEWLLYLIPDLRFRTQDPDKWLSMNDAEYDETYEFRNYAVVHDIVEVDGETEYIMALHCIESILMYDGEKYLAVYDAELIQKLCRVLRADLSVTNIGTYSIVQANEDLIQDESYMDTRTQIEEYDDPEDEEDDTEDQGAEEVEGDEDMSSNNDLEDAALRSMMGGDEPETEEPEEQTQNEQVDEDDGKIYGYLVEEKRNKSVKRTFYKDLGHTEKITGEKGKVYVDVTEEKAGTSKYMAEYVWNNNNNFVPTNPVRPVPPKKNPAQVAKDDDTLTPKSKNPEPAPAPKEDDDVLPQKFRTGK